MKIENNKGNDIIVMYISPQTHTYVYAPARTPLTVASAAS